MIAAASLSDTFEPLLLQDWMNGQYLKSLPLDEIVPLLSEQWTSSGLLKRCAPSSIPFPLSFTLSQVRSCLESLTKPNHLLQFSTKTWTIGQIPSKFCPCCRSHINEIDLKPFQNCYAHQPEVENTGVHMPGTTPHSCTLPPAWCRAACTW